MKLKNITFEDGESRCSTCGKIYSGRVTDCSSKLIEATYWSYGESDPSTPVTDGKGKPATVTKHFKLDEEIPRETRDDYYWKRINKLEYLDMVKCHGKPAWSLFYEYEDETFIKNLKGRNECAIAIQHNPGVYSDLSRIYRYREEFTKDQLIEFLFNVNMDLSMQVGQHHTALRTIADKMNQAGQNLIFY